MRELGDHLVGNDRSLIEAWLALKVQLSPHTRDSYIRAATRLLTWCQEHSYGLLELTEAEGTAYLSHLAAPPAHWLRPRRGTDALKPTQLLYGRLRPPSLKQERTLLVTLFEDLLAMGRAWRNPFRLTAAPRVATPSYADKALSMSARDALLGLLYAAPDSPEVIRWRWVAQLLYHTGIRRIEARFASMADFIHTDGNWTLRVTGKRQVVRNVTVSAKLLVALREYRVAVGLAPLPSPDEVEVPVVLPLRGPIRFLSARSFNVLIDGMAQFVERCVENPHLGREFLALTPHRFRHTCATHRLASGARLETTQDELGHKDPKTTRLYAQTSAAARRHDADLL